MPRYLIQSLATGDFLVPNERDFQPEWKRGLHNAGGGVLHDIEQAGQLLDDWTDFDDMAIVVDLDRLGTANDYC